MNRGTVCLDPREAQGQGLPAVRAEAERRFGAGEPSFQPADGAVVNVATIFAANQPRTARYRLVLLGQQLTLTGTASWRWDFGDGQTLTTTSPGGVYPDKSVTHTYLAPGVYTVTVTTRWEVRYAWGAAASAPVPGPAITVTSAPVTVTVREAYSQLTGG